MSDRNKSHDLGARGICTDTPALLFQKRLYLDTRPSVLYTWQQIKKDILSDPSCKMRGFVAKLKEKHQKMYNESFYKMVILIFFILSILN